MDVDICCPLKHMYSAVRKPDVDISVAGAAPHQVARYECDYCGATWYMEFADDEPQPANIDEEIGDV